MSRLWQRHGSVSAHMKHGLSRPSASAMARCHSLDDIHAA
jgi:hypothetical protein